MFMLLNLYRAFSVFISLDLSVAISNEPLLKPFLLLLHALLLPSGLSFHLSFANALPLLPTVSMLWFLSLVTHFSSGWLMFHDSAYSKLNNSLLFKPPSSLCYTTLWKESPQIQFSLSSKLQPRSLLGMRIFNNLNRRGTKSDLALPVPGTLPLLPSWRSALLHTVTNVSFFLSSCGCGKTLAISLD